MSRDWLLFLEDIIVAAEKVARLTEHRDFDAFVTDEGILDAVLLNLLHHRRGRQAVAYRSRRPNPGRRLVRRSRSAGRHRTSVLRPSFAYRIHPEGWGSQANRKQGHLLSEKGGRICSRCGSQLLIEPDPFSRFFPPFSMTPFSTFMDTRIK